jgi:hypothetical protein
MSPARQRPMISRSSADLPKLIEESKKVEDDKPKGHQRKNSVISSLSNLTATASKGPATLYNVLKKE